MAQTRTLREVIADEGRGSFARCLLHFHACPDSLTALYEAYVGGDHLNQQRLERACPGIETIARAFEHLPRDRAGCLAWEFPILQRLDEVLTDPYVVEV